MIIEDLDRLDPAHLFRILNVISAHIDNNKEPDKVGNKFGFSNIVIMTDYNTTRHIFEHFMGRMLLMMDMSKFLTKEPFKYSLLDLALPKLKDRITKEVGVDKDLFSNFRILNLKLASLTMRDIVRIYDFNVSHRIVQPFFEVNNNFCLSTSLPIFKLLIYMTELGMSVGDIEDDLSLYDGYKL